MPLGVDDHPHHTSLNLDVARAISLTGDPTVALSQLDAIRHALHARAGDQSLQLIDMLSQSPDQTAVARDQTWRDVETLLEPAAGPSPRQETARPLTAVVLTAERPPAAVLPRLLDPHSPVAVVALEPLDLGYRLDCTPTRITLHPVGVTIPVATNHALDHPPARCPHIDPPANTDPLVVELLGPIRAPAVPQLRGKALAVLAFLAHRRTATADQLDAACWDHPHRNTKRRRNILADLRRAIGPDHLPRVSAHGYALSPAVTTDTALFDHHLTLADAADNPTHKAQLLECALVLVKGPVLTYPPRTEDSYRWIDDDNLLAHWELKIERTALTATATMLDLDQPQRAAAVLEQALRALPLNTGLTEQVMAAHAHAGHFDAVERIYQNHRRALRRHLDLDPEPSTDALHAELTQRGSHPASSPPSSSPTSSSSQPA